ncbi:Sec-independent protein translocase subunit TatA [Nakamurella sp.]|jgi:sec-independent protein translocase protein TatA|uniref:Sec-independent protein translocase subunit TatA n=1 Tax=Nakamurella sp. TaxID=1869182 RepID=UPI0037831D07
MGGLSWWHWLIIIAAFILLFGAKRLPDAARSVGRSLRILKSEVSAMHDDEQAKKVSAETDVTAAQPTPTAQITGQPPLAAATPPPPLVNGVPEERRP